MCLYEGAEDPGTIDLCVSFEIGVDNVGLSEEVQSVSPAAIELCLGRPGLGPDLELGLELDVSYVMTKDSLSPSCWSLARVRK